MDRTLPGGCVVGVDVIASQPPKGVSTIQGNFLSHGVQEQIKDLLRTLRQENRFTRLSYNESSQIRPNFNEESMSRSITHVRGKPQQNRLQTESMQSERSNGSTCHFATHDAKMVDVILSDMSEPWAQAKGLYRRNVNDPYYRMMNTSGMSFRDHAGSMVSSRGATFIAELIRNVKDLCSAALNFANSVLKPGGHFVCKFYQGREDRSLESKLRRHFDKVHRERLESSRSVRSASSAA